MYRKQLYNYYKTIDPLEAGECDDDDKYTIICSWSIPYYQWGFFNNSEVFASELSPRNVLVCYRHSNVIIRLKSLPMVCCPLRKG